MDTEGLGGPAQVAVVGLERGDDELLFELAPGLLQGHSPAYQLIDDPHQATAQALIRHRTPSSTWDDRSLVVFQDTTGPCRLRFPTSPAWDIPGPN